ncbi:hypothetical protein, partial [Photorhabdus laumondii]|uniref:hypothetical protein n=1 Tax=Photorhabdus laumondii TaxID=2218628 RepID=UPI001E330D8A
FSLYSKMPIFKIGIFVLIQDDGYFYVCPAKLKPVRLKQLYRGRNDTLRIWGTRLGELFAETNDSKLQCSCA